MEVPVLIVYIELVVQALLLLVFGTRHMASWRRRDAVWWLLTAMVLADTARAVGLLLLTSPYPLHILGHVAIFGFVDVVTFGWLLLQHKARVKEKEANGNTLEHRRA